MSLITIFCFLCVTIPSVLSLGFVNSQIPQIPQYFQSLYGVGKVDPRLKFRPTYTQQLAPWGSRVLLSVQQARTSQSWTNNRAVVVRAGAAVTDPLLYEGALVIVDPACTSFWTAATYMVANPLYVGRAAAMEGAYVNGVSLNNANPLTLNADLLSNLIPNIPARNAADANQQYNYVLCPETQIRGVIEKETWGANRAKMFTSRILKPTALLSSVYPDNFDF
jgi:hypothetical protein